MEGKQFLYFITNTAGSCYYSDRGTVMLQGQLRSLSATPDGWEDIAIGWERNMTYFGLMRNFSFPLGFVRDGAEILNYIYLTEGAEAKAFLVIYKLGLRYTPGNPGSYSFVYTGYYKGEFDFSTCVPEESRTTINILDGGLEALVKANENTQYEIPLDDPKALILRNDGVNLRNTAQYLITDGFGFDDFSLMGNHIVNLTEIQKEVSQIAGTQAPERTKVANSSTAKRATGQWFMKATADATITITYDFILTTTYPASGTALNPAAFLNVSIQAIDETDTLVTEKNKILLNKNSASLIGTFHIQGSVDLSVNAGDEVYLYTFVSIEGAGGGINTQFNYSGEGLFKVDYLYRHPASNHSVMTAARLFNRIIDKMSEGKYTTESAYLDKRTDLVLSSGDGVRKIEGAKIKTSFSDFWQWLSSKTDVHFGIKDGKAYIGELKELFQPPIIIPDTGMGGHLTNPLDRSTDIGEVRNLKISTAKDLMFNRIKVGYPNQNYEDVNGRTEFNSTQNWTVPITRVNTELDLISPYRSDCIGIEYIRINFDGKKTTDSSSDNDTFAFQINKTAILHESGLYYYYTLDRTANPYLTGVVDPESMYNVKLSPKHSLIEKGRFLHSCLDHLDGKVIKFQTADKNAAMVVAYPSGTVKENQDIVIGALPEKYFKLNLIEFETYRPVNLMEIMSSNDFRRHCLKFIWNGKVFTGYIIKAGIKPADNEVQTYQLLSTAKNDMTKFL